jgi:hypothetical protein
MKPIARQVLATSASSVTLAAIPSTYDDLLLVASTRVSPDGFVIVRFNGVTTGYSSRILSNATSTTDASRLRVGLSNPAISTFSNWEAYIPNYAGSTVKSVSATAMRVGGAIMASAGLWNNTSAITSLELSDATLTSFATGSSFSLYGIKKA